MLEHVWALTIRRYTGIGNREQSDGLATRFDRDVGFHLEIRESLDLPLDLTEMWVSNFVFSSLQIFSCAHGRSTVFTDLVPG